MGCFHEVSNWIEILGIAWLLRGTGAYWVCRTGTWGVAILIPPLPQKIRAEGLHGVFAS